MDIARVGAALALANQAQIGAAVLAEIARMNHQAGQDMAAMLEESVEALAEAVAAPPPGQGGLVDIAA